ncbi:MAG: cation diffusion facilitator family transporter, partial [Patescibacteria group bacterium]
FLYNKIMNTKSLLYGEKAAKEGMLYLIFLGIIKAVAGLMTGMTVIWADSISTFSDTLGIFASYIGLRLSRKTADERFEYGYYKIETFAALLISLGIIYLGYYIFMRGYYTFQNPGIGEHRIVAIISTIISIGVSYVLAKKLKKAGEDANSLSLIASAQDKKMDIVSAVAVLISVIASYKNIPYIEGVVSIIIAIFILKIGIFSAKESLFFLLDYWDDPILSRQIKKIFRKEKEIILKVNKLRLRRAGTFIFGQAYVEINPYADMADIREELKLLQGQVEALNPYIRDFVIYTQLHKSENLKVAIPIKKGNDLDADVATSLRQTNAYLFAEIVDDKIKKFYIKKLGKTQKKIVQLNEFLKKEDVNILIDNNLNSLVYYNLRRIHHVLIYPHFSDIKNARKTLELLFIDI